LWIKKITTKNGQIIITRASLEVLPPTLRKEGSEIYWLMNPQSASDPIAEEWDEPMVTILLTSTKWFSTVPALLRQTLGTQLQKVQDSELT
jgi:hypothetical protein